MNKKLIVSVLSAAFLSASSFATQYFTEAFYTSTHPFDLDGLSLTFTWDSASSSYSVSATNITALPVAPTGQGLGLRDDNYATVSGTPVSFYGTSYSSFNVAANGSIYFQTPTSNDDYSPSLTGHFGDRRIALFWDDLYPYYSLGVTAGALQDRVVITYNTVSIHYSQTYNITAQCELFFDGRIRMSWIDCNLPSSYYAIVGFSEGNGYPADYVSSDLSEIGFNFDSDEDGIPDDWEIYYYGSIDWCLPDADDDEDLVDNLGEYISGTDPLDSSSVFKCTAAHSSSQMTLVWNPVEGRKYRVFYKNSLGAGNFTALSSWINYPTSNFVTSASLDQRYYKVSVDLQ